MENAEAFQCGCAVATYNVTSIISLSTFWLYIHKKNLSPFIFEAMTIVESERMEREEVVVVRGKAYIKNITKKKKL